MSSKLALSIGAGAAAVFGLLLVLAPAKMLEGFGLSTPVEGIVLSRDVGVTLLGLAAINWLARNAGGPAVQAILAGNILIQVLEILVNGYEIAAGDLPNKAAPGLIIHVVLGVIFLLGLRGARAKTAAKR